MNAPVPQLVDVLHKYITDVSPVDGTEFIRSVRDRLESCSTLESYLTGIPEKQYVFCISQSLQHVSENASDPQLGNYLWNPIVASLIDCISKMSHRNPAGLGSNISQPSARMSSSTNTAKKVKPPPPKSAVKTKQPSNKAVPLERRKGVETPSAQSTKVDSSYRNQVVDAINSSPLPFFNQMKGGKHGGFVTCKKDHCSVCTKFCRQLPITKCADIKNHVPNKQCTSSGWYPHALPHIWAAIKRAHSNPKEVVKALGLPNQQYPALDINVNDFPPLPTKRPWTRGRYDSVESGGSEESAVAPSPKVLRDLSPIVGSWVEEVDRAQVRSPTKESGDA